MMTQVPTQEQINAMSLAELRELAKDIEREFAAREMRKRGEAVALVREIATEAGLTVEELFHLCTRKLPKPASEKAPPKYRHTGTGEEWSGLGARPKWVKDWLKAGNDLETFRIPPQ